MKPTAKQLRDLWKACEAWRDKYKPVCAECCYQRDRCVIHATELTEAVCDVIGYTAIDGA